MAEDAADTRDGSAGGTTQTSDGSDAAGTADATGTAGRREVTVPEELFRVVVVFSTVLSIASILLGFGLLDAATAVVENPGGSLVVGLVTLLPGTTLAVLEPHLQTLALLVGLAGVGCIGLGVWIYAIGTRFRTEMGKHKEAHDEGTDNG